MIETVQRLLASVNFATQAASNEAQLRHEVEKALESACRSLAVPWTPFQLERAVREGGGKQRFIDVAHGAVIIEYEPPRSFGGKVGGRLSHARAQVQDYALLLAQEEGRDLAEYVMVAWDGAHINFGRMDGLMPVWEPLRAFDATAGERLLLELQKNGIPLVHPRLIAELVGPDSEFGAALIPRFFGAIRQAEAAASKTRLLFTEWSRLPGQVVGVQSEALKTLLARQGIAHGRDYRSHPSAYLFALNTYIALLAKIVTACALPNANQNILDASVSIHDRMTALESGEVFEQAGIVNMLSGDFFSWYLDDADWPSFQVGVSGLVNRLAGISFDVTRKSADSTRDLFKGIYQTFVPSALRHALGEFYTPDWLAEHALTTLAWREEDDLLDPTCGSGTFLIEALRRRLRNGSPRSASELIQGLYGIDLNPLAVLTAKVSLAVFLAPYLKPAEAMRLPIFLADAINSATRTPDACYEHVLQTELGSKRFRIPARLVRDKDFFRLFARIRFLIDAGFAADRIIDAIAAEFWGMNLHVDELARLHELVGALSELHHLGWNGIWCSILADRFAAGAIPPLGFIAGNPPWVKWSHLPPDYAALIKPHCLALGVFSSDRWVGGIESDLSTVITYEVIDKYLKPAGKLGFFITGTVFTNESSEGFRQFSLYDGKLTCEVLLVEDFTAIAPFDGVTNRPAFLVVRRNGHTQFPVSYRRWSARGSKGETLRYFHSAQEFQQLATPTDLLAAPVPGGGARPWLIGTAAQHDVFVRVFSSSAQHYAARKGVTTDRNGIFWLHVVKAAGPELVIIANAAGIGRTKGIAAKQSVVEASHIFPLLRGRGVRPFRASPDPDLHILVPQRGMHGDPDLALHSPQTFRFLQGFRAILEERSSYKRFQKKQGRPFYSLWSTGPYTFSPYKVLWREMGGGAFAAAYVGSIDDPLLGPKLVIPDHKLYFIPVDTETEAAYLTGFLNAETIASAVTAYAAQLSLGVSVAEYLHIPKFDPNHPDHIDLSTLAQAITQREDATPSDVERQRLDHLAQRIITVG